MRTFGLIGYPLGHSFSVPYFTRKFEEQGIDAVYRNFPMKDTYVLPELLRKEKRLVGLNVTVPHKQAVIPYLDGMDAVSGSIGAVNTIMVRREGERIFLQGHNTDVTGFRRSLVEHLEPRHDKALVLGTGGSSRAVVHVLRELHIPCQMVSRSGKGDALTYEALNGEILEAHRLVVNTTPLGMHPGVEGFPPIPYSAISPEHLLFDLIYNPEKTRFLTLGEERGASIVNGYDMLVYQAEASWEIWNSKENHDHGTGA